MTLKYQCLYLSFLILLILLPRDIRMTSCPKDYEKFKNGRCFRLYASKTDWVSANRNCRADGADLAYIEDIETQQFVMSEKLQTKFPLSDDLEEGEVWFGLNDRESEGVYKYENGKRARWFNWGGGQGPNSPKGYDDKGDCAMVPIKSKNPHNWYDETCDQKYDYLCEWPRRAKVIHASDKTTMSSFETTTSASDRTTMSSFETTTSAQVTTSTEQPSTTRLSSATDMPVTTYSTTDSTVTDQGKLSSAMTPGGERNASKILRNIYYKLTLTNGTPSLENELDYVASAYDVIDSDSFEWKMDELTTTRDILELSVSHAAYNHMRTKNRTETCQAIKELGQLLVDIASFILDQKLSVIWQAIKEEGYDVMDVSHVLNDLGFIMAGCLTETQIQLNSQNLNMTVVSVDTLQFDGYVSNDFTLQLKKDVFRGGGARNRGNVVAVKYSTLHELVNEKTVIRKNTEWTLNSRIESVSLQPLMTHEAQDSIIITFAHEQVENLTNAQCVFWNFTAQEANVSAWSTAGCRVASTNITHTMCKCSHLTNFAILTQTVEFEIPEADQFALSIITYIGCGLSIAGLLTTFVVLFSLGDFQNERNNILLNLTAAMLLAQVGFLIGTHQTENKIVCKVVAVFLHFLFLAMFSWMFVEAIQLCLKVVTVFSTSDKTKYFILLGWGLPILIVGITAAVDHSAYGGDKYCWLDTQNGFIWAFTGPALAIIIANLIVLVIVLKTYMTLKATTKKTTMQKMGSAIRAAMVLFPILGTTWIFGFFAIDTNTVVFQYLFAIFNSAQGLLIFLFHCVSNEEVKNKYIKRKRSGAKFEFFNNKVFPGSLRIRSRSSKRSQGNHDTKSSRKDSIRSLRNSSPSEEKSNSQHGEQSSSKERLNDIFEDEPGNISLGPTAFSQAGPSQIHVERFDTDFESPYEDIKTKEILRKDM